MSVVSTQPPIIRQCTQILEVQSIPAFLPPSTFINLSENGAAPVKLLLPEGRYEKSEFVGLLTNVLNRNSKLAAIYTVEYNYIISDGDSFGPGSLSTSYTVKSNAGTFSLS